MKGLRAILIWGGFWAALAMGPIWWSWDRLPDPVAIHWGITGAADGSLDRWLVPVFLVGVVTLGLILALPMRSRHGLTRDGFVLAGTMGAVATASSVMISLSNLDAATWDKADPVGVIQVALILAVAGFGALTGAQIGNRFAAVSRSGGPSGEPLLALAPGEVAAWIGTARSRWFWILALASALAALVVPGIGRTVPIVTFVLALAFGSVQVRAGIAGLKVKAGPFRLRSIPLDRIAAARAVDLGPVGGGWGYRLIPGGTAVVVRMGDALEVEYRSGRTFAVTVDDAATGAAVLNGLVASRLGGSAGDLGSET